MSDPANQLAQQRRSLCRPGNAADLRRRVDLAALRRSRRGPVVGNQPAMRIEGSAEALAALRIANMVLRIGLSKETTAPDKEHKLCAPTGGQAGRGTFRGGVPAVGEVGRETSAVDQTGARPAGCVRRRSRYPGPFGQEVPQATSNMWPPRRARGATQMIASPAGRGAGPRNGDASCGCWRGPAYGPSHIRRL